ncbi:MAG: hypothetical protein A3F92_02250 [Candidatus Rokubacteria bacterium RIFCSPLOWO2_12_FULL_71_22]|nr:MAG: hypothetical protein A3F92_02250 [Candidatus Rokubacteria bacterium RIFCSPLOWO2_12_FULL_71_22]
MEPSLPAMGGRKIGEAPGLVKSTAGAPRTPDLSVVMPVYNEAGVIARVVRAWTAALDRLDVDYELRLYDDGSRDGTGAILERLAQDLPRLVVTRQPNSGHGPTILRGYGEARGTWVFQVDSDDEMGPEHFARLWENREHHDLLLGRREARHSPLVRRVITGASRLTVWALFGRAVGDVNAPYRLFRRSCLAPMLRRIPRDTFAPNVILSGLAARDGLRVLEVGVPHRGRSTGRVSLVRWRLWRAAARSFRQTVAVALHERLER